MPTNPKWLEHTERAAWDTVQTLRRQIEQEQQRSARLAPAGESWKRILDLLDKAKGEHHLAADRYADILELLCSELGRAKSERDALDRQLSQQRQESNRNAPAVVEVIPRDPRSESSEKPSSQGSSWFTRRVDEVRRQRELEGASLKRLSYEGCLTAVERKLEELEDTSPADAAPLAAELGALALRLAELGRRTPAGAGTNDDWADDD